MKKTYGLQNVDYGNCGHIHSNQRGCSKPMDIVPLVPNQEAYFKVSSNSEGRGVKLRLEQNFTWIMD